jgi:hypothetical protein
VQRVVALGQSGNPENVPELVAALRHEDGNVRRLAASALGKIGDPRAVEPLLSLLADETKPQVRQYVIKALGRIGDPRAQSKLEQIANNSQEEAYKIQAAQHALAKLQKPSSSLPSSQSSISAADTQSASSSSSPDTLILEAVTKLGGTLGRTGLAQFLTGSKVAWLEAFAQHSCYGQLASFSQQAVLDIIDALITDGKLMTTKGSRPKVILTNSPQTSRRSP